MRDLLRAAALASILVPAQSWAQSFGDIGRQLDENGRPLSVFRVTTTFQVQTPQLPAASLDDQKAAIEIAHKTLYAMAAHECEALTDSFKMDCRLTQLTLNDLRPELSQYDRDRQLGRASRFRAAAETRQPASALNNAALIRPRPCAANRRA